MAECKRCVSEKVCRYNDGHNLYCKEDYECPHFKNKDDVAEVKHGEWIINSSYLDVDDCHCSLCDQIMITGAGIRKNYCPNCGAKMDGDKNE